MQAEAKRRGSAARVARQREVDAPSAALLRGTRGGADAGDLGISELPCMTTQFKGTFCNNLSELIFTLKV